MKKAIIAVVSVLALAGVLAYNRGADAPPAGAPGAAGGGRAGGPAGAGGRPPMPVEFAPVKTSAVAERVLIVGNLIGAATVEAVPKVNGRLETVNVKLGDPVRRGQIIAKVEDREIREQVRQAEAPFNVARSDDPPARGGPQARADEPRTEQEPARAAAPPPPDLRRHGGALSGGPCAAGSRAAQFEQAKSRLDELRINLPTRSSHRPSTGSSASATSIPARSSAPTAPVASLVDIRSVRMVANLVEKDVKRVPVGTPRRSRSTRSPARSLQRPVSRVAPVFDPATRTAEMEIEVPNTDFRLKPGMYARVQLTVATRADALTVPSNALVTVDGKTGVFVRRRARRAVAMPRPAATDAASHSMTAKFVPVETGIRDGEQSRSGQRIQEGARVVTTGAGALKDGDRIVAAASEQRRPSGRGAAQRTQGAADEHSSPRDRTPGHDVHALGRDHPDRPMALVRLPVDLMPDVSFPSITVRVGYPGVGPLEMEELVTRPLEQAMSAVAGLERLESTSPEGSSRVTLNFAWGTDLNEAADDVRNRLDRVRGRLPEDADAPVMFKFDANAQPIMGVGVESVDALRPRDACARSAEHDLSPRIERVPGVASVTVEGGLRRQIHVELSQGEDHARSNLPVDRIISLLRSREPEHPARRDRRGRPHLPRPQPGTVREPRRRSATSS